MHRIEVKCSKMLLLCHRKEYLGYELTREVIKPQPKKVEAILALTLPQNDKQLRRFLGMVKYYRDLWERQSKMLLSLTNLVGECGHTKATRATKTKHTVWFCFGTMNEGEAYSDSGCHFSTPNLQSLPTSFFRVSWWTSGVGKGLP